MTGKAVELGALTVRRLLPVRGRRLIGSYCFLDRFGPLEFAGTKPMDVAPHPHIGLQTVTWLLDGEIVHKDSLDSECLVRPGQLSLMTAGRGIAHTEETPKENSGWLNGVQLWVALPDAARGMMPRYQCTREQARREVRGSVVTSILGTGSEGVQFHPGAVEDVAVQRGERTELGLEAGWEYGVLLMQGDTNVEGAELVRDTLYYVAPGRGEIAMASREGARVLLFGGPPFGEPVLMWWNFVARTAEEIDAARTAWERGEVFGEVKRYEGERLVAPALVLRPR